MSLKNICIYCADVCIYKVAYVSQKLPSTFSVTAKLWEGRRKICFVSLGKQNKFSQAREASSGTKDCLWSHLYVL